MKRGHIFTLLAVGTFLFSGGHALAQTPSSPQGQGGMMGGMGMMGQMPMMGGMMMHHMGMMGMTHFPHLLMRAQGLAPDKAEALRKLSDERLPAFMRQMTEVQIAKMALKNTLSDPTASEKDIEKAFQQLAQEKAKLTQINREAILELRKILGPQTFAKLFTMPMMGMMGGMGGQSPSQMQMPMMQMHRQMMPQQGPEGESQ